MDNMANFLESYGIKPKMTSDLSDKKPINLFDFSNIKKPSEIVQQNKPMAQPTKVVPTIQPTKQEIGSEDVKIFRDLLSKGIEPERARDLILKSKGVQEQPKPESKIGTLQKVLFPAQAIIGKGLETDFGRGAIDKTKESFTGGLERIQEAGVGMAEGKYNFMESAVRGGAGALQTAFSPLSGIVGETIESGIEKIPEDIRTRIKQEAEPTIEGLKEWYNNQPADQQRRLQNIGVTTELLANFLGVKGIQKATPTIKQGLETTGDILKQGGDKLVDTGKVVLKKTGDILPDRQKIAQNVSTKANRFNAVDEEKFIKEIGETPGEFAVTRGLSDVGEPAVEKATKNYLDSVKQADDAFEQIGGNYKYTGKGNDPIKISLDDLEKRYINTENDSLGRIQDLKQKYNTDGLTFTEINELKRDYSRNFKYGFEDRNSEALARSSNIQNKLREWQFEKANEMGLENIRDINKNTKAWKMYADSLEKKINRSGANNAVSITDWIALSGGNASNLALFLGKKVGTSDKAKQLLIKTLGKTTKSPIIKPNVNKPQIKGLLGQGPVITPAPKGKSNIKVTPSTIQPNVNRKLLALPEGKKPAIITPQTAEKGVIRESKKGLEKAKIGMMNSSDVADNTRIVKDTIDSINDVKQLENLKSEIKELGLPRERELLSELQIKIDGIKELSGLDNIGTTLYKEYGDDLINDFKVLFKNDIRNKTTKGADKYSKVEFNTTPAFKNFKNSVDDYLAQNPWIDKSTQEIYDELKDQLTNTKIKDIKKPVLLKSKTNVTNNNLPNNRNNSRVATKLKEIKPLPQTTAPKKLVPQIETKLKNLTKDNIDDIAKSFTNDTQKLAKIKVVIREHLKKYGNEFKNYMAELVDKIADTLGTRTKLMGEQGIGRDKTALLKVSDKFDELLSPEDLNKQFTGRGTKEQSLKDLKRISPDGYALEKKIDIDKLDYTKRGDFADDIKDNNTIDGIKKQYKKDGIIKPIIINNRGEVIDGNHRINAYKELGIKEIPAYTPLLADMSKFIKKTK